MFETLSINTEKVSVEKLIDALCFFQRLRFCGNSGRLVQLIERLGIDNAKRLIETGNLSLVCDRYGNAVYQSSPTLPIFGTLTVSRSGSAEGRKIGSVHDDFAVTYERHFKRRDRLLQFLQDRLIEQPSMPLALEQGREDFLDLDYIKRAVEGLLSVWAPEYAIPPLVITSTRMNDGSQAFSLPIDYAKINSFVRTRYTEFELTVTPALILAHVLDTRKEILANIEGKSDVWLGEAHERCFRARVATSVERLTRADQIDLFNDIILNRLSIGSAVASGARTVDQAVDLLQDPKTQSFRKWLVSQPPDAKLVEAYYKDTYSAPHWQRGARFKTAKVTLLTGVGVAIDLAAGGSGLAGAAVGAGANAALGALDEFFFQKLRLGWSPSQWVEEVAQPFSKRADEF